MTEDQLEKLLIALKSDASLREQIQAASDTEKILSIARSAGFTVSIEDLQRANSELTDEELEGLSGGLDSNTCRFCECCLGQTAILSRD